MSGLPVVAAHALPERPVERTWLIEGLWGEESVGIVGGEPKCCKSFLALDMAVAVAAGTACLRRFRTPGRARVLLFAAEDALHVVRTRLAGICAASGRGLADLDLQVITAPTVRLDRPEDRQGLAETVAGLQPRLVVLDPFVRLHRIDENASAEVAPLLAFLRELQRRYRCAIAVVHHAKKGAGALRDGQALRGSSEFHAWGDSNLYLRRKGDQLTLSIEHRAAPSQSGLQLRLEAQGPVLALRLVDQPAEEIPGVESAEHCVVRVLRLANRPMSHAELRRECCVRGMTLTRLLGEFEQAGKVVRTPAGFALAAVAGNAGGTIPRGG